MSKIRRAKPLPELSVETKLHPSILQVENWPAGEVLRAARESGVQHVLQKNHYLAAVEAQATKVMLDRPEQIFLCPWQPWLPNVENTAVFKFVITSQTEKSAALAQTEAFLHSHPRLRRDRHLLLLLVDELFVNVKKAGNGAPGILGYIFIAVQQAFMLLGSWDSIGSLVPDQIINNAFRCYELGVSKSIRQDGSGAGIGSYFMFENSLSMALAVKPGQTTAVVLLRPMDSKVDEAATLAKNIHWYTNGYMNERK